VARQLRGVAGVTEVNPIGGYLKEYRVAPDMAELSAHRLCCELPASNRNDPNSY